MLQSRCREKNAVVVIFGFPKTHNFSDVIVVENHSHVLHDVLQRNHHVLVMVGLKSELQVCFSTPSPQKTIMDQTRFATANLYFCILPPVATGSGGIIMPISKQYRERQWNFGPDLEKWFPFFLLRFAPSNNFPLVINCGDTCCHI